MFGKITLNRYSSHNNITDVQNNNISRNINAFSMSDPTILDNNVKNGGGENKRRDSKFEVIECSVSIILNQFEHRIKINVEGGFKFSTNRWNTTKNTRVVNRCTIPSIARCNTSRDKDIVSSTFLSSYSYAFILKSIEMFNREPFMFPFSKNIVI